MQNTELIEKYKKVTKGSSPQSSGFLDLLENLDSYTEMKFPIMKSSYKAGKPKVFATKISDIHEKAYQRAFYLNPPIIHQNGMDIDVIFFDLEIPVLNSKNPRRPCLDLIGEMGRKNAIFELKEATGNSPLYGIYELLAYSGAALENRALLPEHKNSNKKDYWGEFNRVEYLIFAAPKSYWGCWRENIEKFRLFGQKLIKHNSVNRKAPELLFAEFEDIDFKVQQKEQGGGEYTPYANCDWQIL